MTRFEWAPEQVKTIKNFMFLMFSTMTLASALSKPNYSFLYVSLCLGMMTLSISRFCKVRHAVPAPEVLVLMYSYLSNSFFHFAFSLNLGDVDAFLFSFDRNYGNFRTVISNVYSDSFSIRLILGTAYASMMLVLTLAYLAMPDITIRRRFLVALATTAVLILPFYLLCPCAGPRYFLQGTPGLNAMPSGHFAWALLIFWFARRYCGRAVRVAALVFMVLTCLATLGTGEHYIIDLVVSVPFAAGIWALVHWQWRFAGISMTVVSAWVIMLGEGWALSIPPVPVWIFTGMTLVFFALPNADQNQAASVCYA
jgi:hypothetical protein